MKKPNRPLQFSLHPDDVLTFVHIPKTGGISLIAVLDSVFPKDQICPLHSLPTEGTVLDHFQRGELQRYRLVRGHYYVGPYDGLVHHYMTPNPVLMTVLRDPMARSLSHYRFKIQQKELESHVSLYDWVTAPEHQHTLVNLQTRMIAGAIKGVSRTDAVSGMSDAALLRLAREKLDRMPFVGLTERYHESTQLLCYTFDWPMLEEVPYYNKTERDVDPALITAEGLAELEKRIELDRALYTYGVGLFEQRYRQMVDELMAENLHYRLTQGKKASRVLPTEVLQKPKQTIIPRTADAPPPPPPPPRPPVAERMPDGRPILGETNKIHVKILRTLRWGLFPYGTQREQILLQLKRQIKNRRD